MIDSRFGLRAFERPRLWLGIWIFGWGLCIVLSLISPPQIGVDIPDSDKLGHVLAYAVLSAWAVAIFARRRAHWRAALALLALGIALEFAQGWLTDDRMMDARDAIADAIGIVLGQLLALSSWQTLLQRAESRLLRLLP